MAGPQLLPIRCRATMRLLARLTAFQPSTVAMMMGISSHGCSSKSPIASPFIDGQSGRRQPIPARMAPIYHLVKGDEIVHARRRTRQKLNRCVERVQQTILDECWKPAFARYLIPKQTGLHRDLESYLSYCGPAS
jgi:hypothetical protein